MQEHLFLQPATLKPVTEQNNEEKITDQEQLQALIITAYTENSLTIEVVQTLRTGARHLKNFPLSECEL